MLVPFVKVILSLFISLWLWRFTLVYLTFLLFSSNCSLDTVKLFFSEFVHLHSIRDVLERALRLQYLLTKPSDSNWVIKNQQENRETATCQLVISLSYRDLTFAHRTFAFNPKIHLLMLWRYLWCLRRNWCVSQAELLCLHFESLCNFIEFSCISVKFVRF